MPFFVELELYLEVTPRSAPMNMAIDEALLEYAKSPSIRFYRWDCPAISFGYFGRFADVASYARERDLVRRWTGGGTVFHGEDLTYSIVIPTSDPLLGESSMSLYKEIHRALVNALAETGQHAVVAAIGDRGSLTSAMETGVTDPGYNSHCFAHPVRADVMIAGRKVAGAAQRRTRGGLLHQGSIQYVDPGNGLAEWFAKKLSNNCEPRNLPNAVHYRAEEIAARKY